MRALELVGEPLELLQRAWVVGLAPRFAHPRLDRRPVALGEMAEHVALLVPQAALHGDLADTERTALRSALEPSSTNSIPCSGSSPRSTRSDSSAVATVAFSVDPSHSPSGIFTPSVVIPKATIIIRPFSSSPSSIITASRRSPNWRLISSPSASRVRSTNDLDTADFDVDRALVLTCSPTGSYVRRYRRVDTPASIRSSTTRRSGSRSAKC